MISGFVRHAASAVILMGCATAANSPSRDPWLWPFASDSIWNMPLGSGAVLVPAGLNSNGGVAIDPEILARTNPGAPQREIFAPAGWETREGGSQSLGTAGFNDDLIVPDARKNWTPNYSAAVLQPDGFTVENLGPICRPREGSPVWAYRFPKTDLRGDGITGSHGGSGLSALGGSIRRGELLDEQPIRHAIKVNIFCEKFTYFGKERAGFRWPSDRADSYAAKGYKGSNPAVVMGSLLCLKPDLDLSGLGLKTTVARKLAQALQDYGAYISDDAAHDVFYFCAEREVREECASVLGISLEGSAGPFYEDVARLVPLLQVVDNNSAANIGGGGVRRAPMAPPLAESVGNPLPLHPGPSLVPNAGMEHGDKVPDGWAISSGEGVLSRETAAPFAGAASLRLETGGRAMARVQVPAGSFPKTVTLSGQVRTEGAANAMLGLMCYTKEWKALNFLIAGNSPSGAGWREVSKELTLPEGTGQVDVALLVEGKGTGMLDEVKLLTDGKVVPPVEAKQAPAKAENAWSPAQGFYPEYPDAWMTFHNGLKEKAAKGGVDLLFIGDSLTLGWDKELWEKYYAPRNAANFGVGGDGTPQLLWRMEHGGFDGLQPKVVVLMIGVNNVWPGYPAADTAKGIRVFVEKLKEKMPASKILLLGMLPAFDAGDGIRTYAGEVNKSIAALADGKAVRFLDFGPELLDGSGNRKAGFYQDDRLHLAKPAYESWGMAMEGVLGEFFGK
ncbi:GDSL-type esterase/lipase family protein [Luteolibacter soli]|uniref:GDSL-type esterase/lipase family protein n=1 Tax=Luteolibacter soli TaxID=3135280 RepID=A0ABU9AVV3_9BACT